MDIKSAQWHNIHTKNIEIRKKTRPLRLQRRKWDIATKELKENNRRTLSVPQNMSFFSNYEEIVVFINTIRQRIFDYNEYVFLNFSKCSSISMEVCVVLAAEIERCNKKQENSITGNYPNSEEVYFFLNELGFFNLLKIKSNKTLIDNDPDIDIVKLTSGTAILNKKTRNPENLMRGIKDLFTKPDSDQMIDKYENKVFRALTEAMQNSVEHAYPDEFKEINKNTCVTRWWRAAFKNHKDNSIYIVLYDQGIGIPSTIHVNWQDRIDAFLEKFSKKPSDADKLSLAMERGRSRTKIHGRGQGSHDIQQLIRQGKNSILTIFSCRGQYVYDSSGDHFSKDFNAKLNGSLLVWRICLENMFGEL